MGSNSSQYASTISPIGHPMFTRARWISLAQDQKLIETVLSVTEYEWKRWKLHLSLAQFDHEYLLLPEQDYYSSGVICGTSGELELQYPNYPYLLTEEIEKRHTQEVKFDETDLWFLLYCLLAAQYEMWKRTKLTLGDVRPHNVFINEDGDIKLASQLSWPNYLPNYQKYGEQCRTFLAPEQCGSYWLGNAEQATTAYVFSIGFTIINSGILVDCSSIYEKNNEINWLQYQKLLTMWKTDLNYSEILRSLISCMCAVDPENRITAFELWEWISQYGDPICDKETFVIQEAPNKLHKYVYNLHSFLYKRNGLAHNTAKMTPLTESQHCNASIVVPIDLNRIQTPIKKIMITSNSYLQQPYSRKSVDK